MVKRTAPEDPGEELPEWCTAEVLVLGCGNPLMGDDGFGPAVAERLLNEGAGCRVSGVGDERMGVEGKLSGIGHGNSASVAVRTPDTLHPTPDLCVINAGTASRGIIFNLMAGPVRPKAIIIIDALNATKTPGELFWVNVGDLSIEKAEDFSLHMTPASNMLLELQDAGVEINILACQPKNLPEAMSEGLSPEVANAVGPAAGMVMDMARTMSARKGDGGTPMHPGLRKTTGV